MFGHFARPRGCQPGTPVRGPGTPPVQKVRRAASNQMPERKAPYGGARGGAIEMPVSRNALRPWPRAGIAPRISGLCGAGLTRLDQAHSGAADDDAHGRVREQPADAGRNLAEQRVHGPGGTADDSGPVLVAELTQCLFRARQPPGLLIASAVTRASEPGVHSCNLSKSRRRFASSRLVLHPAAEQSPGMTDRADTFSTGRTVSPDRQPSGSSQCRWPSTRTNAVAAASPGPCMAMTPRSATG